MEENRITFKEGILRKENYGKKRYLARKTIGLAQTHRLSGRQSRKVPRVSQKPRATERVLRLMIRLFFVIYSQQLIQKQKFHERCTVKLLMD